jgi:hypothetical protein
MLALPRERVLFCKFGEKIQLFFEQNFVVLQIIAEKRVAFGKAATAQDRLGPTVGQSVQGRKPLEHTDRVIRRQHRNGCAQFDPRGARGNRRQQNFGRCDGKI